MKKGTLHSFKGYIKGSNNITKDVKTNKPIAVMLLFISLNNLLGQDGLNLTFPIARKFEGDLSANGSVGWVARDKKSIFRSCLFARFPTTL